jgi:predicted enzyme related to lactoylglutathione lyase
MNITETDKLGLRPVRRDDLDAIAALFADPEVMRFSLGTKSREESLQWIDGCLQDYRPDRWGYGLWAAVLRSICHWRRQSQSRTSRLVSTSSIERKSSMGTDREPRIGFISWRDLTVENAKDIRDFYCRVVGWESTPHDMGEYSDFNMNLPSHGETVAGICHARGANSAIPPQWMIYINVDDVDKSAQLCVKLGGKIVDGPRMMGGSRFCVIQDPAGAVAALISN